MTKIIPAILAIILPLVGCGSTSTPTAQTKTLSPAECAAIAPTFADTVAQANGAPNTGLFGEPERAVNGVRGAGRLQGGFDVFSLDLTTDGAIVLSWNNGIVCNSPGADLNVFENSFFDSRRGDYFFEAIVVSVSLNGTDFVDFPYQYLGTSEPESAVQNANWVGFAGMHPVYYHETSNNLATHGVQPLDATQAGGDAFDLDHLPDSELAREIKTNGFRFVKLTAAQALGMPSIRDAFGGYAEIDGVYARVTSAY